jgi:hypothetical protein
MGIFLLAACDAPGPTQQEILDTIEPAGDTAAPSSAGAPPAADETLAAAVRDPDLFARARRLATLLPTLGPDAVPEVKAVLEDPTLDPGATGTELLLRFWAVHEPEAATTWAVTECAPVYRLSAVLASLPVWAASDPEAAWLAATAWRSVRSDVADTLPIGFVRGRFSEDPWAAAQFVQGLEMGILRQRALATFVRELLQQEGIDVAMRWAESVPDDDAAYKLAVYRQMGAALPLFDHDAALRWCEAHCDGPHGSNLRSIIARRWVLTDGAAALAFLERSPDSHERRVAVRAVYSIWAQRRREEALAWMAANGLGPDGEPVSWIAPAIPVQARLLSGESPEEAISWAERIDDEEAREIALIDIARRWRSDDEAAAEAWLAQSDLSEEAREQARGPRPGLPRKFTE